MTAAFERRELPEETSFEALFRPDRDFPYLAAAGALPFQRRQEFAAVDAWWLAELALLSYVPEEELLREVLERAGRSRVTFFECESTHCVVADELVVFRGTDGLRDALKDLDALFVRADVGHVHRGFRSALDLVWDELVHYLDGRPAWFGGHSLGGALATLAASRYAATSGVYTFGSPRVGDAHFAEALVPPVHRVVNNNDLVARLPPPLGFKHAGDLYYLDESGRLHAQPRRRDRVKEQLAGHGKRSVDNVKRWLAGDFSAIPYDSLVDHAPAHYAIHLWNHLVDEHAV